MPMQSNPKAKRRTKLRIKDFNTLVLLFGWARFVNTLVGSFDSIKDAKVLPIPCMVSSSFLNISVLLVQKLAKAIAAKPSSRIDLNPPIILNHYSKKFLRWLIYSFCFRASGLLGSTLPYCPVLLSWVWLVDPELLKIYRGFGLTHSYFRRCSFLRSHPFLHRNCSFHRSRPFLQAPNNLLRTFRELM